MEALRLIVWKRGSPAAHRTDRPQPTPTDLGFAPNDRLVWTSADRRVQIHAWSSEHTGAWTSDDDATIVVGDLRRRERRWGTGQSSARALRAEAAIRPLPDLLDDLRGVFIAAQVDQHGDGWVVSDPIGHRCLYHGENDDVVVVSSRAALAAEVLASAGTEPRRDADNLAWLAFTSYRVGASSGYTDVRVAAPGSRLALTGGAAAWQRTDPFVVAADDPLRSMSLDDLAALVLADVADALAQYLDRPADRHVLDLTGGKDSRMVLAAAVRAGLAAELEYETVGPPALGDVVLASSLAERFGLRHDVRFIGLRPETPYAARIARFIESTAGMVNSWDLSSDPVEDGVRLTGLCGELLRSCTKVPDHLASNERIAELFSDRRVGRLGLLRPATEARLRAEAVAGLMATPSPSADPLDRAQVHFASSRMRFTRLGSRQELDAGRRMHPLYSPLAIRAAMSLDPRDRQAEVLVATMLRIASPALVEHPFTDAGWSDHARARLDWLRTPAPTVKAPPSAAPGAAEPADGPANKATPLVAQLLAKAPEERIDFLAESFADHDNPVWDTLDRAAATDGLARWGALTNPQRQELFGAATAVRWIAGQGR